MSPRGGAAISARLVALPSVSPERDASDKSGGGQGTVDMVDRETGSQRAARWGPLFGRHVLTLVLAVFCIGFWGSVSGLPPVAANFPRILIALLAVLMSIGLMLDVRTVVQGAPLPRENVEADFEWDDLDKGEEKGALAEFLAAWGRAVLLSLVVVAFLLLVPRVGFYVAVVPFLAASFVALGIRRPAYLGFLVAATAAGAYLLFDTILALRLPAGILPGG